MNRVCNIAGCRNPHEARGLCHSHYCQLRRRGELALLPKPTPEERFWRKVDMRGPNACWEWNGKRNNYGYGIFHITHKRQVAHRVAYEFATGMLIGEFQIDHACHNRACCNPNHLRLATNKQNSENIAGPQRNSKSGIRGVYWHKAAGKWAAEVKHNGKPIRAGLYESANDAARAVLELRLTLFTHSDMDERVVTP